MNQNRKRRLSRPINSFGANNVYNDANSKDGQRVAAFNNLNAPIAFIPDAKRNPTPFGIYPNTNNAVSTPASQIANYLGPKDSTKAGKVVSAALAVGATANEINRMTGGVAGQVAKRAGKTALKAASDAGAKALDSFKKAKSTSKKKPAAGGTSSTTTTTTTTSSGGGSSMTYSGKGGSYLMNCDKPNNKKINLSTGVRSGLIVNEGEIASSDFSPLFMMGGDLLREDNISTSFKEYINTIIYPTVSTAVQFSLNYAYELSLTDFTSWFYTMTKCLQFYYTLDSIVTYCSDRHNTNQGLRYARTKITSAILLKLNLLRDLLGKQPIPPNVLQYMRFMCQNYKFSEIPGSPIYRLSPGHIFNDYASMGSDSYTQRLSELMVTTLIDELISKSPIYNKINQAMPQWTVPNACLPPSSLEPYYDEGFRTFWFNCSLTYSASLGGTVVYTRSENTSFRYWMYTNFLDGVFFASGAFNKYGVAGTNPGLFDPANDYTNVVTTEGRSNALHYCFDAGSPKLYPVRSGIGDTTRRVALQFDNFAVPVVQLNQSGVPTFPVIANQDGSTQVAQECTFETWKQAVYHVTRWLFD